MERPKPATCAWIGLATGVAVYDALCPPGETLSEGVDRALESRSGRVLALGAIAVTASHLANLLPQRYDPFHRALQWKVLEKEPSLPLRWGDKTLEMTPRNSTLYTFLGRTAVSNGNETFEIENSSINHVWVQTAEDRGMYFFASHDEAFAEMSTFMVENQFPMVLNQREVPPCDLQAWVNEVEKITTNFAKEIPDTPPKN